MPFIFLLFKQNVMMEGLGIGLSKNHCHALLDFLPLKKEVGYIWSFKRAD
jgi:hypothetical protein